jgi:hypothetical protein
MPLQSRLLALVAILLTLQPSAAAGQSLQFHDAVVVAKTAEIRFDPFQIVDWRRLA